MLKVDSNYVKIDQLFSLCLYFQQMLSSAIKQLEISNTPKNIFDAGFLNKKKKNQVYNISFSHALFDDADHC